MFRGRMRRIVSAIAMRTFARRAKQIAKRAASGLRSLPSTKPLLRQNGLSGHSSSLSAPSRFGTPIPHSEIFDPLISF
jgi:hypothetical protein